MHTIDLLILITYFAVVFGIGAYFFKRAKTSKSYFLADRSVGWVAVGASLFASNISSEHFIGLAGSGASSGLAVGSFEWLAVFMSMILAWVFVPFYLRSGVYTMPEFLERRYGPACRWYLTTVSVIAYVVTKISVSLYAGALVLQAVLGWDFYTSATVMVVATGIYTVFGGLAAVIYTELLQAVVLLLGAATLTIIGLEQVGGMAGTPRGAAARLLPHDQAVVRSGVSVDRHFLRRAHPRHLVLVHRPNDRPARARREERSSRARRRASLRAAENPAESSFSCCRGSSPGRSIPTSTGTRPTRRSSSGCCRPGSLGFMVAALMAALMSSLAATFNSASTLVTFDVYKKLKPGATESQLVGVGRIVTVVMVGLSMLWVPFIKYLSSEVYIYLQSVQAYISPPIAAVFLVGVFWPRANRFGAIASLVVGAVRRRGPLHFRVQPRIDAGRGLTLPDAVRQHQLPPLRSPVVRRQPRRPRRRVAGHGAGIDGEAPRADVRDSRRELPAGRRSRPFRVHDADRRNRRARHLYDWAVGTLRIAEC